MRLTEFQTATSRLIDILSCHFLQHFARNLLLLSRYIDVVEKVYMWRRPATCHLNNSFGRALLQKKVMELYNEQKCGVSWTQKIKVYRDMYIKESSYQWEVQELWTSYHRV